MKYIKPPMLSMNFSENKIGMKKGFQMFFIMEKSIMGNWFYV